MSSAGVSAGGGRATGLTAAALLDAVERHPLRAFAAFAALHTLVWIALPTLLYPNLPLDLIEALINGREWQLGYEKLPPLPWWLLQIAYRLFHADIAYYALSQIAVIGAFAAVFAVAWPLVGAAGAIASVLILDGLHYVNFTSVKFNHDVIQLPIWSLAGYAYWSALRHGRMRHWVLLGFAIGLALWAKYFVVMLALPLALFVVLDRDARRHLSTPGPYVALAMAALVAGPHLLWLVRNDFVPLAYLQARALPYRGIADHALRPLQFAVGQLVYLLPALAMAGALFWPRRGNERAGWDFDTRIITLLAFGPAAAVFAVAAISGRGTIASWGYPLWMFLGLWLVLIAGRTLERPRFQRLASFWALTFSTFAVAFVVAYAIMPNYDNRYRAVLFPGESLGREMSARFRVLTGQPLAYVIGSMWLGGNISHYAPEQPKVLIEGSSSESPLIDLGDLAAKGAIVVWTDSDPRVLPVAYRGLAVDAEVQEPFALPFRRGRGEAVFGWALLRPNPVMALRQEQ